MALTEENNKGSYGLRCRQCHLSRARASSKAWYAQNRDSATTRMRAYANSASSASKLLAGAKERAALKGLQFDLTLEDIVIPDRCPVLGIPLSTSPGSHRDREASPSLDRLVPSKGYVRGNVAVISFRANRIKSNASGAEVQAVATWMASMGL